MLILKALVHIHFVRVVANGCPFIVVGEYARYASGVDGV